MQAALQPYVDSAISKTINCPEDIRFESFATSMSKPSISASRVARPTVRMR